MNLDAPDGRKSEMVDIFLARSPSMAVAAGRICRSLVAAAKRQCRPAAVGSAANRRATVNAEAAAPVARKGVAAGRERICRSSSRQGSPSACETVLDKEPHFRSMMRALKVVVPARRGDQGLQAGSARARLTRLRSRGSDAYIAGNASSCRMIAALGRKSGGTGLRTARC